MRTKKLRLASLLVFAVFIMSGLFSIVNAATADPARVFGLSAQYLDPEVENSWQDGTKRYAYVVQIGSRMKIVYKIVQKSEEEGSIDYTQNQNIYCIKAGPGFHKDEMSVISDITEVREGVTPNSASDVTYQEVFDLKNKSSITSPYNNYVPSSDSLYNGMLWVLDNAFTRPTNLSNPSSEEVSELQEYRQILLTNALVGKQNATGGTINSYSDVKLTDNDIEFTQQLALWHFTNNGNDDYDLGDGSDFPQVVLKVPSEENGHSLTETQASNPYFTDGRERQNQIKLLYQYLVQQGEAHASGYTPHPNLGNIISKPVYIDKTQDVTIKDGSSNNYIVGPYKIKKDTTINWEYDFDSSNITFKDGNNDNISYSIVNANGETDTFDFNKNFYISIPNTTNTSTITMNLSGSYYQTMTEYWSVKENMLSTGQQPLAMLARNKVNFSDSFEATPSLPEFDLALRKYIISVTGNGEPDMINRAPDVHTDTLQQGGSTARYVHSKEPVLVSTGETVLYGIIVYNEGASDGYATEIVDYLPAGLELKPGSTINSNVGWTVAPAEEQTVSGYTKIKTNVLQNHKISAYLGGDSLSNTEIKVECVVTATPTSSTQYFKNIAEITADLREGTDMPDNDSEPDSVFDDNTHTPGTEVNGYTPGEQDDDDFEILIMEPETIIPKFDLVLRKYIVSVNGTEVSPSRRPRVDTTPIRLSTSRYRHSKAPVQVRNEARVVYAISIYNEGQVGGYATKIADYLPTHLNLVPAADSDINTTYGWTVAPEEEQTVNGYTKVVTSYLENTEIDAFAGGTDLDSEEIFIECYVDIEPAQGTTVLLKNVAEITADLANYETDIDDRDSQPGNVFADGEHTPGSEENGYTPGEQDDDDFELIEVIPEEIVVNPDFDLALRKFVVQVNDTNITNRKPDPDISPLLDDNENTTTAYYNHTKSPVAVSMGDEVTFMIRVYNEGEADGYVTEITDYLPPQLEFMATDELNTQYGWQIKSGSNGRVVTTDITSPSTPFTANSELIYNDRPNGKVLNAFEGSGLDYIDVLIKCKVKDDIALADMNKKITNIAEISQAKDLDGNIVASSASQVDTEGYIKDIDSYTNDIVLPTDAELPEYGREVVPGTSYIPGQEDDDDYEKLQLKQFDLALRKFITAINGTEITSRIPRVTVNANGTISYNHPKTPVDVINGDKVTYTIRVYNEGDQAGYAAEIEDDIPYGLVFLPDHPTNLEYGWVMYDADGNETQNANEAKTIKTTYLSRGNSEDNLIPAFDPATMTEPAHKDVKVVFEVHASIEDENRVFINTAEISEDTDENGNGVTDVDSEPGNHESGEDDIDIEKVQVKYFDLALRKFITAVNETAVTSRIPVFTVNEDGTYTYEHDKTPITVVNGDIVTYTIRVFNEGTQAGYATEIEDDIPFGLEFLPDNQTNIDYEWKMYDENGIETQNVEEAKTIKTTYLSKEAEDANEGRDNLIPAFDIEGMREPAHKDVKVAFRVNASGEDADRVYINTAEVSEDSDEHGNPVDDVDSEPGNHESGEDDIDTEAVKVQYFDLALRKFITGVNDELITSRIPIFKINEDGTYSYDHDKTPVPVVNGDIVTYTIRVFNEGTQAGYAAEIEDDIPEGLEFLPDNTTNREYGWQMYDSEGNETQNVAEAKTIKTTYLSMENGVENLIAGFDPETMTMPDYRDVKVAFRVIEPDSDSDRVYINIAEISEDTDENGNDVDDVDSTPDNHTPGEDDIDTEEVYVKYFDLALKKWISTATTIINGQTTVIQTGHTGDENPEPPVKIEIKESEIDSIVVKFTYTIKVTNEGEIPGYATEIREYIPQGLKFVKADNPDWEEDEDGRVVTTKLADILLRPGESTMIDIVLTWINGSNNFGQKINVAEISKDHNDSDTPDIDSTPDNQVPDEDDIDDAPVVLSVKTGVEPTYIVLTIAVLTIITSGIILIKKYVM